jgi:hypothetical protein
MNPFLITNNCCCASECSGFFTYTDPAEIQSIKSDPDYRYRMSIPCSALKQNTLQQKLVASGNVQAVVTEDANTSPGYRQTNRGRGGGNTLTTSFSSECNCVFPPGAVVGMDVYGPFIGAYTYITPSGTSVAPYEINVGAQANNIKFLCGGGYVDVYSNWISATNLSENPAFQVSPPGLNSTGTMTLSFFGQSTTITLLNTWTPSWSSIPGFQGNWRLDATLELNLSNCYE